jgi:hypothetical protein
MASQGILPYSYREDRKSTGATGLAGLPLWLDLAAVAGLRQSIERHVHAWGPDGQGWTDGQIVLSTVLLNVAGGDVVEDLEWLEADDGFATLLQRVEWHGLPRAERRARERRWRQKRQRAVPSPSSMFRYLDLFHDEQQEAERAQGRKAFIPRPNEALRGLVRVNADLVAFAQRLAPPSVATLDQDATLVESHKRTARYCYKHFRAYQPLNTWWAEQGLVLHSEFRDGNVDAGFGQKRVFAEALACLPEGVEKVYLRSDTAGYQVDLLRYCAEGQNERFGVIEFAIGADVTVEFRKAVAKVPANAWHPLPGRPGDPDAEQEWAEVVFVPDWIRCKNGPTYRFLAIREPLRQLDLPGLESQPDLPFPTMEFANAGRYKVFGLVTNRALPGDELIRWSRQRCGKSEEAHAAMKADLAGGHLPSWNFGANAASWQMMLLALNLTAILKRHVLGGAWVDRRLKALRFGLIRVAGWVVEHARALEVRLGAGHPALRWLLRARRRIACLVRSPPP